MEGGRRRPRRVTTMEYIEHIPKELKLIDAKGIRLDGRRFDELRPIKIEAGVLKKADGSAYLEWGNNEVRAAVYGPREAHPRHLQDPAKALVQCRYNMAPFSVSDRKRPGPDRRSVEISKVISEAFSAVVFVEQFPRTSVDVFIEVLQADAGTRCAGLTAASVALADAVRVRRRGRRGGGDPGAAPRGAAAGGPAGDARGPPSGGG